MASNNYNPYNYPYQQSTAQQYPAYQTTSASNNISQPSRQYQAAPSVATSQPTDYMSYQAESYGGQSNAYGGTQDNSWSGGNYGANRETTSRSAAEVLRNMSNTNYAPSSATAVSHASFTPANASASSTARYSNRTPQAQQVHQPPQSHTAHTSYGQSQVRPRSVNTNRVQTTTSNRGLPSPATAARYPSQHRATTAYNQLPQRTASPAQPEYVQSTQTPVSSTRGAAVTETTQYTDYSRSRQLPHLDASRGTSSTAVSGAYSYADNQVTAPIAQPASNAEPYSQSTITVDPMAVYDPWPEYQRKQEALRAQKAIEDAARAEDERKAEEARKEDERKKEEERKQQEEEERAPQAQLNQSKQKARKSQANSSIADAIAASSGSADSGTTPEMEAEIRALMAKMREFNSKDPALLARIWEEERRAKAPKSPTVGSKLVPQTATTAPTAQASVPQAAAQKKKAAAKEAHSKPAIPVAVSPAVHPPAPASSRAGGNTIWPPEKKAQLAQAAAVYLSAQNPGGALDSDQILRMLDGNPSYIELCEQLEAMALKLDRAAFAKSLLTAVPDVNAASRPAKPAQGAIPTPVNGALAQRTQVAPPAVMKREIPRPAAASPHSTLAASPPLNGSPYTPFPDRDMPAAASPVAVAEMVPIKPELKPPANKEEAARKRNFNDLIDLTQFSEEEDLGPPPKKLSINTTSPGPGFHDAMDLDGSPVANNFPMPASATPQPVQGSVVPPMPANELRYRTLVEPLDRKKALRRNTYNIKTIARDVLLACGRHPETRQLNQHLDILRTSFPQVTFDSDLSTLRWDLIDPGKPPPGYFKDGVQGLAEDADDEDDSEDEESTAAFARAPSHAIGREGAAEARVSALPEATNPFKAKHRGRPPRHSYPESSSASTPATPPARSTSVKMSASAPRPAAAGVGYSAFRSVVEIGPDGNPLPKKRGRPIGWRKAIHGSATAQAKPSPNRYTGPMKHMSSQPSGLRKVTTSDEPIRIDSRSPSVANKARRQSFECRWQNCRAELHNLETFKKHVYKVHGKETAAGTLECLWKDCGRYVENHDPKHNMTIVEHVHNSFDNDADWRAHIEEAHFGPLSWERGDGPASGLSD